MSANEVCETWNKCYEAPDEVLIQMLDAPLTHEEAAAAREIQRRLTMVDQLLGHCGRDGGECMECAKIVCPFDEPLHFHHDGCPACSFITVIPDDKI